MYGDDRAVAVWTSVVTDHVVLLQNDTCLIDGKCFEERDSRGDDDESARCWICQPHISTSNWTYGKSRAHTTRSRNTATLSFAETKVSNFSLGPKVWSGTELIRQT